MKKHTYIPILLCFFLLGCLINKKTTFTFDTRVDNLNLFDSSRNRSIPVAVYLPISDKKIEKQKVVIFSHGYYSNREGANKECSYLTKYLAANGYFVASIQHELPTDDLIPQQGIPQVVRRPFWNVA